MEGFKPTPPEDTAVLTQGFRPRGHLFLYAATFWSNHIQDSSLCLVYLHLYSRLHLRLQHHPSTHKEEQERALRSGGSVRSSRNGLYVGGPLDVGRSAV